MNTNFSPKFKITQALLKDLMEIQQARGFLKATLLSKQWIKNMSQKAFLLETHHTTHIEGTGLTLEQSKKILQGKKVSNANKEDIKEVKNYKDAFNLVSKNLKGKNNITETLIKAIHKELVKGVRGGSAKPGSYRKIQNYVGNAVTKEIIYMPPKPKEVSALMKDFDKLLIQFEKLKSKGTDKGTNKVTKRTIQRDIKNMIDKKIIETKGKTIKRVII